MTAFRLFRRSSSRPSLAVVLGALLAVVVSGVPASATHAVVEYGTAADLSDGQLLEGATVSGTVYIGVRATNVQRATIVLDGSLCAKRTAAPFTCRVDTTALTNGGHVVRVDVLDRDGTTVYVIRADFTVSNPQPSPSLSPSSSPPSTDPSLVGQWTAPFDLPLSAIHASLLPNGKVLMLQRQPNPNPDLVGTRAYLFDPATGETTDVSVTWNRDVFCAGHSLLSDGRLLVTGGHVPGQGNSWGPANTDFFDPATGQWVSGPLLSEGRWYPSNVQLANGSTLIFGGKREPKIFARTVDRYDPATNTITRLPDTANRSYGNYPRLHLLPNGRIPWTNTATTQVFDPATNEWSAGPVSNFGSRGESGNSVLLPGLNKVLQFGGGIDAATARAEIADFSSPTPSWREVSPLNRPRAWANAVLLPDGKVLAVGGGSTADGGFSGSGNPEVSAELFDPVTETWTTMAAQVAARQYHSTAVLLPDGRVLSAGQDRFSNHSYTGEIYSPPYLFRGPRPTISAAPTSVGYGQEFAVSTPDASAIARVALVKPGSVTHSTDFEQRYVDLRFSVSDGGVTAVAPPHGNQAPPGTYMLFVVSNEGVPSVASFVHVS